MHMHQRVLLVLRITHCLPHNTTDTNGAAAGFAPPRGRIVRAYFYSIFHLTLSAVNIFLSSLSLFTHAHILCALYNLCSLRNKYKNKL